MLRLLQKMKNNNEFQAPDWVSDNSATPPVTNKQKRILNISLFLALPFCLWTGWFEFGRAQSGNWRAWVYTFEWPFFGGLSLYLWRRLSRGDIPRIPRPDIEKLAKESDGKDEQ